MLEQKNKVEFANTLRGIAALSVLVSHYFGVFWTNRNAVAALLNSTPLPEQYGTPRLVSLLNITHYFAWGAFGVALFFLISGFVIPFSLAKLTTREFIINRLFRIYPTYMIGFTFTLLAMLIFCIRVGHPFPYPFNQLVMHFFPGLHTIFNANVDGVIWTLDIEIKFYVLCAFLSVLFKKGSAKVFWLPLFIGVSALIMMPIVDRLSHVGGILFKCTAFFVFNAPYLIFMFIGVVFHFLFRQLIKPENAILMILMLFMLFALSLSLGIYNANFRVAWSYGFALLLFTFASVNPQWFKGNKIVNYFADISYPLYVIHGVTGYILLHSLIEAGMWSYLALGLTTLFAILFATLLHKLIELPSLKIGQFVNKQLSFFPVYRDPQVETR